MAKERPLNIKKLVIKLRDDFKSGSNDFILLYAYNGTGKTRLSMEFKEAGKRRRDLPNKPKRDTLYFNAFTEDLFHWDNDLLGNSRRTLQINKDSEFFQGFEELALEEKIREHLERYADFRFKIDYEKWEIYFIREEHTHIKVSRGEENIFIWCLFLAIAQLAVDAEEEQEPYSWVKFFYIDDPISSLDDNNAITVASDLAFLLKKSKDKIKTVISSHHSLFFNVMCNELKQYPHKKYFLYNAKDSGGYILKTTDDTPFFHHVAMLNELQKAVESGKLYAYHFNMLRNVLEKTSTFFGFKDFSDCIRGIEDENLYARALNLLSHGRYSIYEPKEMVQDNKDLFKNILEAFLNRYKFDLPELN